MSLKTIAITISAVFLLGACSDSSHNDSLNSLVSTNSYDLIDLQGVEYEVVKEGKNFKLTGYEEKIIIFDIFATWCPPCRAAAPNLADLQKRHIKDVKVIGVLIEEDKENAYVQHFVDTYGAEYTISNGDENRALSSAIASATDVGQNFPIPLMIMYYKGKYINHYVGAIPEEMVESDIKKALKN